MSKPLLHSCSKQLPYTKMTLLDPDVYLNNSGLLMYGLQESLVVKYVGMEPESIVGVMGGARVYPSLVIIEPALSP